MASSVAADQWLRNFHPAPQAPVQLVCFPHAGGSAPFFHPVSRALSPDVDVFAVQYPGRQERRAEPCMDSVAELADALVEPLLTLKERPLAFFGHSMGASLAFEVASRLEERGVVARALFASGRRAPGRVRDERIHLLDEPGLIGEIKKLGGTDTKVFDDEELTQMIMPAIRADYRAAELYRWDTGKPLNTPIHVHIGDADPKVSLDEAQAWEEHTTAECTMTTYPGGHFYLNDHAPRLITAISTTLKAPALTG